MQESPIRISLWSGPRNVSTALMYSFAQRDNCKVVDEPLYAYYLSKSGLEHPGREEVLKSMSQDADIVINDILLGPEKTREVFFKNMAHHFIDLPWNLLDHFKNIFLIRDPRYVIESYIKQIEKPQVSDLGYDLILTMIEHLEEKGIRPFVIDTMEILSNPSLALQSMCNYAGIEYSDNMLSWKAGARPEDGVWAKYWYSNVHQSTGFQAYRERDIQIPKRLLPLLAECQKIYELLREKTEYRN